MRETLSAQIQRLRGVRRLTIRELARQADVSHAVIAGLQSGKRVIGEVQATKIAAALGLRGEELEEFVINAINECSEKVLTDAKSYPAQLLNLLALQLRNAGIAGETIHQCAVKGDAVHQDVTLWLAGNRQVHLKTQLVTA